MYTCFMGIPTNMQWCWLRRYADGACPFGMYHDSRVEIERRPLGDSGDCLPNDSRYPQFCKCGYQYQEKDSRQLYTEDIYTSTRGEVTIHGCSTKPRPVGLMWDATWLKDSSRFKGPDGKVLCVILPDQKEWVIDGPSKQTPDRVAWTRSGIPPFITVRPSIDSGSYHGWLNDGILSADLSGRVYK